MRRRVTLSIALVALSACTLLTDLDGLSGGPKAALDGGDSGPTNSASSSSSSSGEVNGPDDASVDAPSEDAEAGVDASGLGCTEDVLVGSNVIAPTSDGIAPFAIDAYGYTAVKSGTGKCIWIYIKSVPPSEVVLGVYSSSDAQTPSKLLAEGVVLQPKQGWNAAPASAPIPVTMNATIWIGVTALKSGMEILEYENGSCGALYLRSGDVTGTTHAPTTFTAQDNFPGTCTMSAYVSP